MPSKLLEAIPILRFQLSEQGRQKLPTSRTLRNTNRENLQDTFEKKSVWGEICFGVKYEMRTNTCGITTSNSY